MARNWTLRDAFAHFDGAKADNPRWGWSAVSADGETVVLALWEHLFRVVDGRLVHGNVDRTPKPANWHKLPGNKSRIKHLRHAMDRCGGRFRVVRVRAVDPKAEPPSIAERWPDETLVMRVDELSNNGEFRASIVS
ncbi:MAG TPA: hypothetical protein VGI30_09890 [Caulobacteraceae bacterium]|jgi:hypothetical protein